jgi:surfactin synthase thioesterase subunit
MNGAARLILLPGLGTDARLFASQRAAFPSLEVPAWIAPRRDESLSAYARRWAQTVVSDPPFFLGGVSFGGMVAYEASRYLRPRAVFLIASCRSRRSIPGLFKIGERLSRRLPGAWISMARVPLVRAIARIERLSPEHRRELLAQAFDADLGFLRWAVRAITTWESEPSAPPLRAPAYQIHGIHDRLIRLQPDEAASVIVGGGHLINVTHAPAVNEFIRAHLERVPQCKEM